MNSSAQENVDAHSWRDDLFASRDLSRQEKQGHSFVIGWFEGWRVGKRLAPGREAATAFWRQLVLSKERERWQLDGWGEGMGWYLHWLGVCQKAGGDGRSLAERVRGAVDSGGARRGLAVRTRECYRSPAGRHSRQPPNRRQTAAQKMRQG